MLQESEHTQNVTEMNEANAKNKGVKAERLVTPCFVPCVFLIKNDFKLQRTMKANEANKIINIKCTCAHNVHYVK